jgi:hypothetical protein
MRPCQGRDRGFESRRVRSKTSLPKVRSFCLPRGELRSILVEERKAEGVLEGDSFQCEAFEFDRAACYCDVLFSIATLFANVQRVLAQRNPRLECR